MEVDPQQPLQDVYLIDTNFLEHTGHVGVYVLTGPRTAILDTGASTGVDRVREGLEEIGVDPGEVDYLLPSHVHLDHAGGAGYLAEICPDATVICHPGGYSFLTDPEDIERLVTSAHRALGDLAEGYGDIQRIDPDRVETLEDGETLNLGNRTLTALEAPGHAPHQLCYHEDRHNALFTADEVGMWMRGEVLPVTPPPTFDFEAMLDSLDRFEELNPDCLLFPHFGRRSDAREGIREYRQVLVDWVEEVRDLWEEYGDEERVREIMLQRGSFYHEIWDERSANQSVETDTNGVLLYLKNQQG